MQRLDRRRADLAIATRRGGFEEGAFNAPKARHLVGAKVAHPAAAQPAIRHTKLALNNWLRLAGPAFDASLALEFLDMTGPEVHEGVAAVREKRAPEFG